MNPSEVTTHIEVPETPWNFASDSAPVIGAGPEVMLVDGTTFAVSAGDGDIDGTCASGLFMSDTRVLDRLVLTIDGSRIETLSVIRNGPFSATFVGRTVGRDDQADSPMTVIRHRYVGRGMREDIEIRNHASTTSTVRVRLQVGSDFASLFDVKSGRTVHERGTEPRRVDDGTELTSDDGIMRVSLHHSPPPNDGDGWCFEASPGAIWHLCTEVTLHVGGIDIEPSYRCGDQIAEATPVKRLHQWRTNAPRMTAGDPKMARAIEQAVEDLGALRIFDPDHPSRVVVAAGAPWFMTLFGRDSIITAWMALLVDHDLARGVLRSLADLQGTVENPVTEEQPGRILHEVRFDAATSRSLGGHNIYYGTADATPLFVMLVAEYWRWTADRALIETLLSHVDRALDWIDNYGDVDGDGYVEYRRATPQGLENQGWKDSWDGIRHGDGRVAEPPIALCEVQGYVYGALLGRAELADALGDHSEALRRRTQAEDLKRRFNKDFWLDIGTYAVGLDSHKRPIDSATSNPGHCLWTGIVDPARSEQVAASLMDEGLFSGWGLRTLGTTNTAYNPLSYHCGSVWPHDTAIAAAGLARYGHHEEAAKLSAGLLEASVFSGGRLPELFAGFGHDDLAAPIPYPSSCSPQAWAAGAPLLLIRSLLGLDPDIPGGAVHVRSSAGPDLSGLRLEQVLIGSRRVSIEVVDDLIDISGLDPGVRLTRSTNPSTNGRSR